MERFNLKKIELKIVLFFILAIVFYTIFILYADFKKIAGVFSRFDWRLIPILLLLSLLNYLLRFFRWHYFLKETKIPLKVTDSLRIFFAGLSMTVTPGKSGELVKAYLLKKQKGHAYSQVIPLIFTERLTDGIGMILLAIGGLFLLGNIVFSISFLLLTILIVSFILIGKRTILRIASFIERKFGRVKIIDFLATSLENMEKLFAGKTLFFAIMISTIAWGLEGLSFFILINAFGDFQTTSALLYSLFIFSASSIAGFLVLIPAGLGVAEGSMTSLSLLLFNISVPQAIFATLLFRFTTLWFGVGIGFINLLSSFSKLNRTSSKYP